jgi:hypothetical protein
VEQLTAFYEAITDDARIGTTHICLYFALYNAVGFINGELGEVNRDQLMQNARISRKTYNKCMKELQEYGYIKYEPSSNPQVGSKVQLKKL